MYTIILIYILVIHLEKIKYQTHFYAGMYFIIFFPKDDIHCKQGGHWGDSGWIRHKLVLEVDWQKN